MLGAGLEPAWGCPLGCLRPLRLPFRHPSLDQEYGHGRPGMLNRTPRAVDQWSPCPGYFSR